MHRLTLVLISLLAALPSNAVEPSPLNPVAPAAQMGILYPSVAQDLIDKLIELIEVKALPARVPAEYDDAKRKLRALLDGNPNEIDRPKLYKAAQHLLQTLDTDEHSGLWSLSEFKIYSASISPQKLDENAGLALIPTSAGNILHYTPAPIASPGTVATAKYLNTLMAQLAANPAVQGACGVVVDLTLQTGGQAWAPFSTLIPFLSDKNGARVISNKGIKAAFATPAILSQYQNRIAPGLSNPLERFKGQALAVVIGPSTAGAGEMIAIGLQGEPGTKTFGYPTRGMTTANITAYLPDNAVAVIGTSRYALGEQAAIHGALKPDVPALPNETSDSLIARAAQWAAEQSLLCRTRS